METSAVDGRSVKKQPNAVTDTSPTVLGHDVGNPAHEPFFDFMTTGEGDGMNGVVPVDGNALTPRPFQSPSPFGKAKKKKKSRAAIYNDEL